MRLAMEGAVCAESTPSRIPIFIYVTHDQREALALSDRIAVIEQGRVQGTRYTTRDLPASSDTLRSELCLGGRERDTCGSALTASDLSFAAVAWTYRMRVTTAPAASRRYSWYDRRRCRFAPSGMTVPVTSTA